MDYIAELKQVDFWNLLFWLVIILSSWKFLSSLFDWFINKFGIETRVTIEKKENKKILDETAKLAQETAKNLKELQDRHIKDETEFRTNLNNYMKESREDRKLLHDEVVTFSNNRNNDRAQSLSIQKQLTDSIEAIAKRQDDRDEKIKELTTIFVEKQISDFRWEIISVADKIAAGKKVSKEAARHAIATHRKYEKIIEERGLTNGEVDISIEIIMEFYLDNYGVYNEDNR